MQVLSAADIRAWDQYTIEKEPISSLELMDRASWAFVEAFMKRFTDKDQSIIVCCGTGNNGGDGLAVARMLHYEFYEVMVWNCRVGADSADRKAEYERLPQRTDLQMTVVEAGADFPEVPDGALVIDALFGTGLSRPIEGFWAELIEHLNGLEVTRVAIDMPSGLMADQPSTGAIMRADWTYSFEVPKLAFFLVDNAAYVGHWEVLSIGLHPDFLAAAKSQYHWTTHEVTAGLLRVRGAFSHKGTFGHALLINGSLGMMGAAILSARACYRSGVGLVSLHSPQCGYQILQTAVPEAMVKLDEHHYHISQLPELGRYQAVGVGCGMGQSEDSKAVVHELLQAIDCPLVLDADALNVLAQGPLPDFPKDTILTPHPGEFKRLFGAAPNGYEQLNLLRKKAIKHEVHIILKGAYSVVACPDGQLHFNSSGNAGMATGGSGDVLTGILTGLLAQGYAPTDACRLAVYLHGLAGDLAMEARSQEALLASDLVEQLGAAFQQVRAGKI